MQLKDATVLVVDDEPYYREIMTEWFQSEGTRVLAAEDGAEALPLLDKNKVDVIVTDIRMPRVDGIELVKQIKATGKYTPTAVAVSGFSDLSSREAYDLGIEAQLSKPVARKVLIAAVQKALTDREELWARPLRSGDRPKLSVKFESLAAALGEKQIAFGHGGFCLKSQTAFPEESPIDFDLTFEADHKALSGQGVVRWCADKEQELGIEISRVNEPGRSWLAELTRENRTVSFIPGTTDESARRATGRS